MICSMSCGYILYRMQNYEECFGKGCWLKAKRVSENKISPQHERTVIELEIGPKTEILSTSSKTTLK